MGQDQNAAGLRRLDEAERRHSLAGACGVLEPEALGRVWVLGLLVQRLFVRILGPVARLLLGLAQQLDIRSDILGCLVELGLEQLAVERRLVVHLVLVLLGRRALHGAEVLIRAVLVFLIDVEVVLLVLLVIGLCLEGRRGGRARGVGGLERRRSGVGWARGAVVRREHLVRTEDVSRGEQLGGGGGAAVAIRRRRLGRSEQRRERAGESVDLVRGEHRAVGQLRLLLGEQALQPPQQRELAAPCRRGPLCLGIRAQLLERLIERAAPRRAGRESLCGILAFVHEALAHELLRARDVGGTWTRRDCECR